MKGRVRAARSFLFVPASRPDRFAKALACGADCVVLDLEDAVAPDEKPQARVLLARELERLDAASRQRLLVRINATATPWHEDDLALVAQEAARGLAGVMVPKAESPQELARLAADLGGNAQLVPLVESLQGLDAADLLARAPQVARLAFGHLDFQLDVGMRCGRDEAALAGVRSALVFASRRAGIPSPVDGVTVATSDDEACSADARRASEGGFGGKLCIHPAQVPIVNAAFSPDPAQVAWARRVLEAQAAHAGGVFVVDGRMVDAPVLAAARRLLDAAA
ncbi:MAG: HpcH/HpaI aldolase/citrate lyase family protein [Ramlibacter sp.]